jgi:hypothetical protein
VDLVNGTKSTSLCPDRRQFLQLEGNGPVAAPIREGEPKFVAEEVNT